jgi:hypothetical protein
MKYSEKEHKRHSDFMNALLFPGFLAGVVNGGYMESVQTEDEGDFIENDEDQEDQTESK